jgi:hypothetical protein
MSLRFLTRFQPVPDLPLTWGLAEVGERCESGAGTRVQLWIVDGANFMVREEGESWMEDEWFTNDLDLDK